MTVSVEAVSELAVVVARVDVPVTANVPWDVRDDVAVMFPPVSVLIVAVIAFSRDAKKVVEVALVITPLVLKRLVK